MVEFGRALHFLQLYLYAFLSYLQHSRCCDVPNLDVCENLQNGNLSLYAVASIFTDRCLKKCYADRAR